MKRILVIIMALFLIPIIVNAETITYNICKSGCEYNNIDDLANNINSLEGMPNVIINFNDSEIYESELSSLFFNGVVNSLTINGNNARLVVQSITLIEDRDYSRPEFIKINNLNIESKIEILIGEAKHLELDNTSLFSQQVITIIGSSEVDSSLNSPEGINQMLWLNNDIHISDSSIEVNRDDEGVGYIALGDATVDIKNSTIKGLFIPQLADVRIYNTDLENTSLLTGYMAMFGTNIFIYSDSKLPKTLTRKNLNREVMMTTNTMEYIFFSQIGSYIETELIEEYINYGLLSSLQSHIYIYQEVDTTITSDTKTNKFESEFKNTYENSEGYDDIKDLPIEWKSENESIATLDNGTIKPIANGQVDLVGTRGNDIYTIHLTVDMPAKKTNEKKGRMAPSTKITINSVFKDIDISSLSDDVWEISDPKVAKIVNGEIISLQKGETDIVATINGIKYIYHLTVSDTLVSKEIKVPITGKNIKLWVVIVTILLLGVIGTCTYILIKKK